MSEHTPGPWEAVVQAGNSKGTIWCSVETPEGDLISTEAHPLVWIRIENALLIAAAPDLLAELEYRYEQGKCGCGHAACDRCKDDLYTLSVIKRAKGETE